MLLYELKKIFAQTYHIIFLGLLIVGSLALFTYSNLQDQIKPNEYQQVQKELSKKSKEERKNFIQEKQDEYVFYTQKGNSDTNMYVERYGNDWIEKVLVKDYKELMKSSLIDRLINEEDNLLYYDKFITNIKEQFESSLSISIFNKNDNFIIQRGEKVSTIYENMKVEMPDDANGSLGIENVLHSEIPNIAIILAILYLFYYLIVIEDEQKLLEYNRILKISMKKQLFYRWFAMLVTVALLQVILFITMYITAGLQYGFKDITQPIQSILNFVGVPFTCSVGLFFILVGICKMLIFAIFIATLFFVYAWLRNYLASIFTVGVFVLLCQFLSSKIGNNSLISYIGLFDLLHPEKAIYDVTYIRMFSNAIPYWMVYIFVSVFIVILLYLMMILFERKQIKKRRKITKANKHSIHSLFFYETKKLWLKDFGIVCFVIFLFAQYQMTSGTKSMTNMIDIQYNYYVEQFGDRVSIEIEQKIADEKERLQNVNAQLAIETDIAKTNELLRQKATESGFLEYSRRYTEIKENSFTHYLIKEDQYRFLFDNTQFQNQLLSLFVVFMIVLCMFSYDREHQSGVISIQKMNEMAGIKINRSKWLSAMFGVMCTVIAMNGYIWLHNIAMYPDINGMDRLCDMTTYFNTTNTLPIGCAYLFQTLWQIFISGVILYVLQFLYRKWHMSKFLLFIFIVLLALPLLGNTVFLQFAVLKTMYFPWLNQGLTLLYTSVLIILCICITFYERRYKK